MGRIVIKTFKRQNALKIQEQKNGEIVTYLIVSILSLSKLMFDSKNTVLQVQSIVKSRKQLFFIFFVIVIG